MVSGKILNPSGTLHSYLPTYLPTYVGFTTDLGGNLLCSEFTTIHNTE